MNDDAVVEGIDAQRFPQLATYLSRLPLGLGSYPECQAKASMYRGAMDGLPAPLSPEGLGAELSEYIVAPTPANVWIPEVVHVALFLAMADGCFADEVAYLAWIEQTSAQMFRSPMYRLLMMMASPKRLANGAQRRWSAFHKGTKYEIQVGSNGAHSCIEFPLHLYPALIVRGNARAILEAYRASGAKDAVFELVSHGATRAEFRSVWFPEKEK